MPSEVAQILKTIEDHSTFQSVGSFLAETRLEKLLVYVAAVSLVLSIVLLFIGPLRSVGLVVGLVFLLTVVVLTLVQAFSVIVAVRHPLAGYAKAARARLEARSNYVSALAVFSSEGLLTAKKALESDTGRMQKRLGMLVGAVEKVGFIPAGATLYYAALQASSSTQLPANLLMAFVFGLYAGAFLGHRLIEALRFNSSCIEEAYELCQSRERFGKPNRARTGI